MQPTAQQQSPLPQALAIPQPTPEDDAWREKLLKEARGTMLQYNRLMVLAEATLQAIADKNLYRLDFITSLPPVRRKFGGAFGGAAQVRATSNINYLSHQVRYDYRSKFPQLRKGYFSLMQAATSAGFSDGARLLLAGGASAMTSHNSSDIASLAVSRGDTVLFADIARSEDFRRSLNENEMAKYLLGEIIRNGDTRLLETALTEIPSMKNINIMYEDSNGRDRWERNPVNYAIYRGKTDMFDAVLAMRLQWDENDIKNGKFLEEAIRFGNRHAFDRLIAAGAPTTDTDGGWSPLWTAVGFARPDMAKTLLDLGGDAAYTGVIGPELLRHALHNGGTTAAAADTADLVMDRFALTRAEIESALQCTKVEGIARKRIKLRLTTLQDPAADAGDAWQVLGPQQVGTVTLAKNTGVEVMDIFNFATRERLIVANDARARTLLLREAFDEVKDKQVLEAARAHLPKPKPAAPKVA